MPIIVFLFISVIIAVMLYYIIYYRPAKRRAERTARHRAYLQRRAELIKECDEMYRVYFYIKYLDFIKKGTYGIDIKEG